MTADSLPDHLNLLDALIRWAPPSLVDAVRAAERKHTPHELADWQEPKLTSEAEWRRARANDWLSGGASFAALSSAWAALKLDLRRRIEAEQLYVSGIDAADPGNMARQPIAGVWAAEFRFDLENNVIRRKATRYLAIQVSNAPFDAQSALNTTGNSDHQPVSEIGTLDDDTLIALLHEQAKRVIARPNVKLSPPGMPTVMPLIQGKMRSRAEQQTMLDTIGAEAEWLSAWATSKTDLHHIPSALTIRKVLGAEYKVIRARSTAATQNLKR